MGEVIGRVDEHRRVPRPERDPRQKRPDPMHGHGHARPREPQLADGRQHGGDAHDADHGLRGRFSRGGVGLVRVDHAAEEGFGADDEEGADADADEGEAGDAGGPAAALGEDDGVGDEAEVEDAVDDGDIDVPEDADGFGEGHDEGAAEVDFEQLDERFFLVVAGPPAGVAGFLSSSFCFSDEEGGRVGFFERADEYPGDGGEDHDDPVRPAPA